MLRIDKLLIIKIVPLCFQPIRHSRTIRLSSFEQRFTIANQFLNLFLLSIILIELFQYKTLFTGCYLNTNLFIL